MSEADKSVRAPPTPHACDAQMIVSLAIVGALMVLGGLLVTTAFFLKDWDVAVAGGVGTIIGALATALNAPSGTASALKAVQKSDAPPGA